MSPWVGLLLVALVALAVGLARVSEAGRRRRILARVPATPEPVDMEAHAERVVTLEGALTAGPITTEFHGAARELEEPHARATTAELPPDVRLRVGDHVVALVPPVQVVLGTRDYSTGSDLKYRLTGRGPRPPGPADWGSGRSVAAGDRVRVVGRLARASRDEGDAGYRDRAARYELHPAPIETWSGYPLALYATGGAPRRAWTALAFGVAVVAAVFGSKAALRSREAPRPAPAARELPAYERPACSKQVDASLEASDPWRARDLADACDDPRGAAEASFMMGDIEGAHRAYTKLRVRDPKHALQIAEVESAMVTTPAIGARLVVDVKGQWYKGPRDEAQGQLDCIATRLESVGAGRPGWPEMCLSGNGKRVYDTLWRGDSGHYLPAYSLHDPTAYARFVPLNAVGSGSCEGGAFTMLDAPARAICAANVSSTRMLHYAITGETEGYEEAATALDRVIALWPEMERARFSPDDDGRWGHTRGDFEGTRGSIAYDAQRDLAVGLAAAWLAGDDARVKRFTPYAEAHARYVFEEHLRLVRGEQKVPEDSHSPSDYNSGDMDLFREVDAAAPDAFAAKLVAGDFTSPARLGALVSSRPALREALGARVGAYPKVCRDCGFYALIDRAFRRRFVARLVGATDEEKRWLEVTRRLGASFRKHETYGPILSMESMLQR